MENLKRNQGAQYYADEVLKDAFKGRRGHGSADRITYRQMPAGFVELFRREFIALCKQDGVLKK